MENIRLYRKRLIPDECVLLKDDEILLCNDEYILTKWKTLKKRSDMDHGMSLYCLKKGIKVSKFCKSDDSLLYWYCDIVDYETDEDRSMFISTDLLTDVLIYPNGDVKVVDLDELAEAHRTGLIDDDRLYRSLTYTNALLKDIDDGNFADYAALINSYEN
ncbi:MAG: DUF402 domain-containing protein [Lachnospiraceae bacterium]|nr:DUF402 domain-containing protein [Lachnospiraceae bacterium]